MSIKSQLAQTVGRSSYWFLHTFLNGGSSLPGKITEQIDPDILKTLGRDYDVIIVTGTNGKTLTTSLIVKVLEKKYDNILTNPTGSNMTQGIITAFLAHNKNKTGRNVAVLEVDEANVKPVCEAITPKAFILTNIFRDQLDRYGEIYTTYQKIVDGIKLAPKATIIANGDTPLFASQDLPNPVVYYGFEDQDKGDVIAPPNTDGVLCPICNHVLHYHYITYSNLGDYFCPNCGFHRPTLTYKVTQREEMTPTSSEFQIDQYPYKLNVGGLYNIYNALAAYSVGRQIGLTKQEIADAFNYDEKVFGRQEMVNIDGHDVTLILVKNPVGLNQVIEMIGFDQDPFTLAMILNANPADGIDTSWIWDGNFEDFSKNDIKQLYVGGERYKELAFRFLVSGAPENQTVVEPNLDSMINLVKNAPTKKVYFLATYTAMLQLRKKLAEQHFIKAGM